MLTNLVASVVVSVVTNTVDVMPMMSVPGDAPGAGSPYTLEFGLPPGATHAVYRSHMVPVPNPTNKVQVTTCKEVTVLEVDWQGGKHQLTTERVLWEKRREMVLIKEWK